MSDHNVHALIEQLEQADSEGRAVRFGALMEASGMRSFGPALVIAGLIVMSPAGAIPGMATMLGVIGAIMSVQILLGRRSLWLPRWIVRRKLDQQKLNHTLDRTFKVADFFDRVTRERLTWAIHGVGAKLVALALLLVSCIAPMMEVIPWGDTVPAAAFFLFGLAFVTRDGLLALFGFGFCAGAALIASRTLL